MASRRCWPSALACVAGGVTVVLAVALALRLFSESLSISGNVAIPISPGRHAPLDVTLNNSYDFPVSVTDLKVVVRQVRAPNADGTHRCTAGDYVVDQLSGTVPMTVAAHATASLSSLHLPRATWPQVGILNRPIDQSGCEGATLTLDYTASKAVKVL